MLDEPEQSRRAAFAFGIVSTDRNARHRLELLCNDFHRRTGMVVYPQIVPSYAMLERQVIGGTIDVAWAPPLIALELETLDAADVVACAIRKRGTSYYSAIFAARGAGIRSLAELRGRRVAWVARESMSGYLVARSWIAASGLNPDELFALEVFAQSHEGVVDAVLRGEVDVGAVHASIDPGSGEVVDSAWQAAEVDVIATAGPIPSDTIVVSRRVAEGPRTDFATAFADPTPVARAVFQDLFQTEAFRRADKHHLASLVRLPGLSLEAKNARLSLPPSPLDRND